MFSKTILLLIIINKRQLNFGAIIMQHLQPLYEKLKKFNTKYTYTFFN